MRNGVCFAGIFFAILVYTKEILVLKNYLVLPKWDRCPKVGHFLNAIYSCSFAIILSSLYMWKGAQTYKKWPEMTVMGHGSTGPVLAWKWHWRRTHTHKSTPVVHKNSDHQNFLHYCELEYLKKETAMNYTRQESTLNSSRLEPRVAGFDNVVKWLDSSVPTPGWVARSAVGKGNQSGKSHEDSRLWPYSSHTAAT